MKRRIRYMALVLVLCMLALTGCAQPRDTMTLRVCLDAAPATLDPAMASSDAERTVVAHLFENLMKLSRGEDGSIQPVYAAAKSYTVEDNLDGTETYTFTLRQNVRWSDGQTVTAHDFVFAFQRIFNSIYPSPFASLYSAIRNSQQVLSGELQASELGVQATDDLTVVFTLSYADPSFLESLAHSSAMPCSQKLFEAAGGRYGTSISQTFSNGPFTLMQWENGNRIYLKKNSSYYDAQAVQTPASTL